MSKATIQAKFGGRKIGSGENRDIPTPKALKELVNKAMESKSNTVSLYKDQQERQ